MRMSALAAIFTAVMSTAGFAAQSGTQATWVATWTASPTAPYVGMPGWVTPIVSGQTLRQRMRVSLGGTRLRVRFTNEFGRVPLMIGGASVRLATDPSTVRRLTFGGAASAVVPPLAPFLSDPVDLRVPDLAEIEVSLYLPGVTPVTTLHQLGLQILAKTVLT